MNHDGNVTPSDISYFAMAISDPAKYSAAPPIGPDGQPILTPGACICDNGQSGGDLGGPEGVPDGKLTFDDIPGFANLLHMSYPAMLAALQQTVPEPSSVILAIAFVFIAAFTHAGRCRSCITRRR